jgi:hypothetical protein
MTSVRVVPGAAADAAFRLGIVVAAVAWLGALALLYWTGAVTPLAAGVVLLCLSPVYLVVVAAVLSVWLGYDKDATALRPVTSELGSD